MAKFYMLLKLNTILFLTLFSHSVSKRKDKMKKFLNAKLPNLTRTRDSQKKFSEKIALDCAGINPKEDLKEESTKDKEVKKVEPKDSGDEVESKIDEYKRSKVNVKCIWANSYIVYSLEKLQRKKDGDYEKKVNAGKVIFNFCQNINTKKELQSSFLWQKNNNSFIAIAGSIDGSSYSKNIWSEFKEKDDKKGIWISLAEGAKCKNGKNHTTFLKIICDDDVNNKDFPDFPKEISFKR